ncbi:MAG: hypothetical protein QNJ46_10765, partial [Leptolyngbyaceae cyanobacterium MO_188.B28]|nr:hypothetical protein [Leptolyngbyaceae cyanobacterium MO_188.B28]
LLVVTVIVVVALVAGPAVIGAVGAAAGALGASAATAGAIGAIVGGAVMGAAAGAVIQMGNNVIDGKELMEGVGKAAIVGAIGGALGGAGGVLGNALGNAGKLGAGMTQAVLKFGIDTALDITGGILGDLSVGNPITLEGILIGAGIGAAVSISTANLSSLGGLGRNIEGVQTNFQNKGARFGDAVGTRFGDATGAPTGGRRPTLDVTSSGSPTRTPDAPQAPGRTPQSQPETPTMSYPSTLAPQSAQPTHPRPRPLAPETSPSLVPANRGDRLRPDENVPASGHSPTAVDAESSNVPARQLNDAELSDATTPVRIGGEDHSLTPRQLPNGEVSLILCSVCGPYIDRIDRLLQSDLAPDIRARLKGMKADVDLLENRIARGDISEGDLDVELNRVANELQELEARYPELGKPLTDAEVPKRTGKELADERGWPEAPRGYEWYRQPNGEPGLRNKHGYRGAAKRYDPEIGEFVDAPPKSPINRVQDLEAFAEEVGMLPEGVKAARRIAEEHNCIIRIRPSNPETPRLLKDGHSPKLVDLKMNTVNEYDVLLGIKEEYQGQVAFPHPKNLIDPRTSPELRKLEQDNPKLYKELEKRYERRTKQHSRYEEIVEELKDEGTIRVSDDGIVIDNRQSLTQSDGQQGPNLGYDKGFTGDYDLFDLREVDGSPIPEGDRRDAIIQALKDNPNFRAQHGDIMDPKWTGKDADENRPRLINQHSRINPRREKLAEISDDGSYRQVFQEDAVPPRSRDNNLDLDSPQNQPTKNRSSNDGNVSQQLTPFDNSPRLGNRELETDRKSPDNVEPTAPRSTESGAPQSTEPIPAKPKPTEPAPKPAEPIPAESKPEKSVIPKPTPEESIQAENYVKALEQLRAAHEAGDAKAIDAARETLDGIEDFVLNNHGEGDPYNHLLDHIDTLTKNRTQLENAFSENNLVYPLEEPLGSGIFVEGMSRQFNTESTHVNLQGKTYSQIEAELGQPTSIDGSLPGRVRLTWQLSDDSFIHIDVPGIENSSPYMINRQPHAAKTASFPNEELHLSDSGISVPMNSTPAHIEIKPDALLQQRINSGGRSGGRQ